VGVRGRGRHEGLKITFFGLKSLNNLIFDLNKYVKKTKDVLHKELKKAIF